jgi:hypothetical protein
MTLLLPLNGKYVSYILHEHCARLARRVQTARAFCVVRAYSNRVRVSGVKISATNGQQKGENAAFSSEKLQTPFRESVVEDCVCCDVCIDVAQTCVHVRHSNTVELYV